MMALELEAFDSSVAIDARHDDLPVARLVGLVHRQPVAIQDAYVFHALSMDAQQIVGARLEHQGAERVAARDMPLRQDRRPGRDLADKGQAVFLVVGGIVLAAEDANAAPRRRHHFDGALGLKCAQMLLGGIGRAKTERGAHFRSRRRHIVLGDRVFEKVENFLLAGGQIVHNCICIQFQRKLQAPVKKYWRGGGRYGLARRYAMLFLLPSSLPTIRPMNFIHSMLAVALAVVFISDVFAAQLRAGPMVGATAMRAVKVWVQGDAAGKGEIEYSDTAHRWPGSQNQPRALAQS